MTTELDKYVKEINDRLDNFYTNPEEFWKLPYADLANELVMECSNLNYKYGDRPDAFAFERLILVREILERKLRKT